MAERPDNLNRDNLDPRIVSSNIFDGLDRETPRSTENKSIDKSLNKIPAEAKRPAKSKRHAKQPIKYYSDGSDQDTDDEYTPFDIDNMFFPCVIVALGRPRSGKSHLIRWLVTYFSIVNKKFKWIRVFTGSQYNDDYDFLPEEAVTDYSSDKLKRYHDQLIAIRKDKSKDTMPLNVIIFDDLLGKLQSDSVFEQLISTYRHTKTVIILANQYVKTRASATSLRSFTSYAFLFRALDQASIKAYYEWYNMGFDKYEDYKRHFLETTKEDHTAMLYIQQAKSKNSNFYAFKAPENAFDGVKLTF